jgi:hypothetical protein
VARAVVCPAFPRFAVEPDTLAQLGQLLRRTDLTPVLHRGVVDLTDDLRRALAGRRLEKSG